MKKKLEFAFLTIMVEVPEDESACEYVSDWLQGLPPEWAGRQTHGFIAMALNSEVPTPEELGNLEGQYNMWYRSGDETRH